MRTFVLRLARLCLFAGLFVALQGQAAPRPAPVDPARQREEQRRKQVIGGVKLGSVTLGPDELALFQAVRKGDRAEAAALLDKGVKPDIRDKAGDTPLTFAAVSDDLPMLELLLAKGADINFPDVIGTALYRAAIGGKQKTIEWLLEKGADVNKTVRLSPAAVAATNNHVDTVKLLISKGARHDVYTAALLGDAATLGQLLKADPSLAKSGVSVGARDTITPLQLATLGGHVDAVALLLDAGADIETRGRDSKSSLDLVDSLPMLQLYLDKRDLAKSSKASFVVRRFLDNGKPEFAAAMIDRGVLPDRLANLFVAADFQRDRVLLEKLVAKGALQREPMLLRPLMSTYYEYSEPNLFNGEIELVRTYPYDKAKALWVIEQGIPLDTVFHTNAAADPWCLLNEAIRAKNIDIVKAMIDKKVNLNPHRAPLLVGNQTFTKATGVEPPVSVAAANSTLEILKLLVEKGSDVNPEARLSDQSKLADVMKSLLPPPKWRTPLIAAAMSGRKDSAEYLVSKGANIKVKSWDGKPLSQVAARPWIFRDDPVTKKQIPVIPEQQRNELAEWFRARE